MVVKGICIISVTLGVGILLRFMPSKLETYVVERSLLATGNG